MRNPRTIARLRIVSHFLSFQWACLNCLVSQAVTEIDKYLAYQNLSKVASNQKLRLFRVRTPIKIAKTSTVGSKIKSNKQQPFTKIVRIYLFAIIRHFLFRYFLIKIILLFYKIKNQLGNQILCFSVIR